MEEKFDLLVKELEKRNVPCKVKLVKTPNSTELVVEVGRDSPEELDDRAFEAISACKLDIGICAEQSGGEVIKSERVCGGAKRYFNGVVWKGF